MAPKKPERVSAFIQATQAAQQIEEIKKDSSKILEVQINLIDNPKFHDRTSCSEADIWSLAENIKNVGLINPVILRSKNGRFERLAGFRRIEACKKLGMQTVKSIILDLSDEVALLLMLSENIQRENLNAYDETISMLQYISVSLSLSEEEVKSFVYKVKNFKSGNIKELSEDEKVMVETIGGVLKKIGNFSYDGFINRLRILNLHPILIEAIRQRSIQYHHAVEINKLKEKEKIEKLLQETIDKKTGIAELKQIVKLLLGNIVSKNPFNGLNKQMKNFNKLPKNKQKEVEGKIAEIYAIFSEEKTK